MLRRCAVRRLTRGVTRSCRRRSYATAGALLDSDNNITPKLNIVRPEGFIPMYRVMDQTGSIIEGATDPDVGEEMSVKLYETMLKLQQLDTLLYDVQRQGRVSFYMTNYGEEASHMGSAAALKPQDVIFGQYRESGVLLYRGFTIQEFMNQCFSNVNDYGKGRQMPVHYGKAALNFQTISSPLATQIPQASGAAYALRHMKGEPAPDEPACSVCYFGDGAASEGDFHGALNFASTLETPTLFFCRNNGYAISTPVEEQYKGDGIASRGAGYGMDTIRVDGNDVWAVYAATCEARRIAVEENRPVLIEAMTYRVGHHSTSDDSTRYRQASEVEAAKALDNPIVRLYKYLNARGWYDEERKAQYEKSVRGEIVQALKVAEAAKKPGLHLLFEDVYDEVPWHLQEQREQLHQHLEKYADDYGDMSIFDTKE